MNFETLVNLVIAIAVVQIGWLVWFTISITEMRRSLRTLSHHAITREFRIERVDQEQFRLLNAPTPTMCGGCSRVPDDWVSEKEQVVRAVAYLRRHGIPARLCLECAEKEHRDVLREWDREAEEAAVAKLLAESGIGKRDDS